MGRPARDLTKAQVAAIRAATLASSTTVVLCADTSCANPVANDGAGDEGGLCALHRQKLRNSEGRCPNCGSGMEDRPVINDLTGKPRANGDTVRVCTGCGYTQRPRRGR
jgi:hypothetical protein